MASISTILGEIVPRLSAVSDTPELDSQVLLAHLLDRPRTWVAAHPEAPLTQTQLASVKEAIASLEAGKPLPYMLGHWEFYGLDFEITSDVLIPRPETELLVERAIQWLDASSDRRTIADVGTGSGCIAVSIARYIPDAKILATDLSRPALEVARRNADRHAVLRQIDFVQCDLLPPHPDPLPTDMHFDLVCANLPYIPTPTLRELPVYGREPSLALDGGEDGLSVLRRMLNVTPEWLAPGGMVLLEVESSLGMAAVSLAYDIFDRADIHLCKDLAGQDRLLEIRL